MNGGSPSIDKKGRGVCAACITYSNRFQRILSESQMSCIWVCGSSVLYTELSQTTFQHNTEIPVKQNHDEEDKNVPVASEITRLDCSFLLPPPAAAAYSHLFSRRRSRPNHRQMVGRRQNRKKKKLKMTGTAHRNQPTEHTDEQKQIFLV